MFIPFQKFKLLFNFHKWKWHVAVNQMGTVTRARNGFVGSKLKSKSKTVATLSNNNIKQSIRVFITIVCTLSREHLRSKIRNFLDFYQLNAFLYHSSIQVSASEAETQRGKPVHLDWLIIIRNKNKILLKLKRRYVTIWWRIHYRRRKTKEMERKREREGEECVRRPFLLPPSDTIIII